MLILKSMQAWQVLPLVPPERGFWSPYSGLDAMCGFNLLIGLDELADEGLIDKEDLPEHVPVSDVDYKKVCLTTCKLLHPTDAPTLEIYLDFHLGICHTDYVIIQNYDSLKPMVSRNWSSSSILLLRAISSGKSVFFFCLILLHSDNWKQFSLLQWSLPSCVKICMWATESLSQWHASNCALNFMTLCR